MKSSSMILGLLSLSASLGCSGSGGFTTAGSGGAGGQGTTVSGNIALADLADPYAAALCSALHNCLGDLIDTYLAGEDCKARFAPVIDEDLPRIQAAIDAGNAVYHSDKIAACLNEISARGCDALLERDSNACLAAADGTVAQGQSCASDAECKGRAYCSFDAMCAGTCVVLEQAGGPCTIEDHCAPGLTCNKPTQRCVQPAAEGDDCKGGGADCSLGLSCVGATDTTPGVCHPNSDVFAGQAGDSCDLQMPQLCDLSLVCRVDSADAMGSQQSCTAHVASAAPCRAAGPDICPNDEYCKVTLVTPLQGTCTSKPDTGESCGRGPFDSVPSRCAPYNVCQGGTCRKLAKLGESCVDEKGCYSERCLQGACVAKDSCP